MKNNDMILYLDDEQTNLEVFNVCFEEDYNIFLANNRKEALDILEYNQIKVLVVDQRMPDVLGIDFIKEVKQIYPHISSIILTAYPDNDLLMDVINKSDVFQFMVKPWKEFVLKQVLDRAIDAYNAKVERDQLIYKLEKAKKRAEESDKLKSAFLANLSHEIRTPLNGIMGFASLLNEKSMGDEDKLFEYRSIIQQSSDQLIQIVEDLINASKIESGSLRVNSLVFNVNDLFFSVYRMFKSQAAEKGLELVVKKHTDDKALIETDKSKLIDVFIQLIRNALKFTHNGQIEFGLHDAEKEIFFVRDTGIGIGDKNKKVIFDFFRQESEALNTRTYGGNGLGLSIAKGFVSLLGGDIWFESTPNEGSIFYFKYPYIKVNQSIDLKDKRILVAEDEDINFLYIQAMLKSKNAQLVRMHDGAEAHDYCKNNDVDLVLMDIKMPNMRGDEAAKLIKQAKPQLPIIAHTAYSEYANNNLPYFDDFVLKPVKENSLIDLFNTHLK